MLYERVKMSDNSAEKEERNQGNSIEVDAPKRVIHFCDGSVEEFSDEEVDSCDAPITENTEVDPKTLSWGPWTYHMLSSLGSKTLAGLDVVGEKIAWGLGITSPKYYYEIEEYKKTQEENNKEQEEQAGWSEPTNTAQINLNDVATSQPKSKHVNTVE
ncbi:protein FAM177A1 [Agrilus planipennis]|uniref:Protein FAM177A1 n=1 Tax=Agrilus planipennis TaxID=224129 RepID=A0A1W4WIP9_AGRPL|nr:protein FAM177A1 [Agrilus planipennis]